ncbi:MAG: tetratricopeptide repeat protein [bacterium]
MSDNAGAVRAGASTRVFVLSFVAIIVAFLVMLTLDLSLAKIERLETASHAASLYADGNTLLGASRVEDAIDRFGLAVTLERDSAKYVVGLGEAILARGEPRQAEATLTPRIEADPTDGALNLAMARVLTKEGRVDDAVSYYHRAIYGRWPADRTLNRNQTRSELIDVLAKAQRREELLAELLQLQDVSSDIAFRKKLARLFLVAQSPTRAADMFRAILRSSPADPDAYAGLGEAALARGNFRTAQADLRIANQRRPGDLRIDSVLTIADTALYLDPEDARAGASENYRRGLRFLHRTVASVTACSGARQIPAVRVVADSANALDRALLPAATRDAQNDANLALSARVWKLRPASCPIVTSGDQALAMVHAAMAQR